MKKQLMALVRTAAICVFLGVVSNVIAADANQPKKTPKEKSNDSRLVIGIVTIMKDNDGNIAEIKVKAHEDLIYRVVLDEKGKELGKTMTDRRARIEGFIEEKSDTQWVTVKTFGEVRAGAPAKPSQNPKAKPAKPAGKPAPKPTPKPRY